MNHIHISFLYISVSHNIFIIVFHNFKIFADILFTCVGSILNNKSLDGHLWDFVVFRWGRIITNSFQSQNVANGIDEGE